MNKEFDSDEFLMLLLRQMEGVASASEIAYIEQCLATEPLAREVQKDAQTVFTDDSVRKNFIRRDEEQNLQKIHASVRRKPSSKRLLFVGSAATLVTVIVTLFYFQARRVHPAPPTNSGPVLELSDGSKVVLNQDTSSQAVKDSTILLQQQGQLTIVLPDKYDGGTSYNTLKVPKGYIYNVTLSDGTIVHLNADTKLKFPFRFDKHLREVFVEGEAFFEVSKDAGRPFVVRTPKAVVKVLGTAFNLNTYHGFSVALVSGAVTIAYDNIQTPLKPGYQATIQKASKKLSVGPFEADTLTAWVKGEFIFNDTPLAIILDVVNRWYNYPVVYDTPEMAGATFTGILRKKDHISTFIRNIEGSGHANVYLTPDSVIHVKQNPRFKAPS